MEILVQWLIDRYESLYCSFVVRSYEKAVHLRRGKVKRVVGPGVWLKLPFSVDEIHKVDMRTRTNNLRTQVIGGRVIAAVGRWRVREDGVEHAVLGLEEDYTAVSGDIVYGMVGELAVSMPDAGALELRDAVLQAVRRRLGRYGIAVDDIWITDFAPARTLRLVQGD